MSDVLNTQQEGKNAPVQSHEKGKSMTSAEIILDTKGVAKLEHPILVELAAETMTAFPNGAGMEINSPTMVWQINARENVKGFGICNVSSGKGVYPFFIDTHNNAAFSDSVTVGDTLTVKNLSLSSELHVSAGFSSELSTGNAIIATNSDSETATIQVQNHSNKLGTNAISAQGSIEVLVKDNRALHLNNQSDAAPTLFAKNSNDYYTLQAHNSGSGKHSNAIHASSMSTTAATLVVEHKKFHTGNSAVKALNASEKHATLFAENSHSSGLAIEAEGNVSISGSLEVKKGLSVADTISTDGGIKVKGASRIQNSLTISNTSTKGDTLALVATAATGSAVHAMNHSDAASTIYAEQNGENSAIRAHSASDKQATLYTQNTHDAGLALKVDGHACISKSLEVQEELSVEKAARLKQSLEVSGLLNADGGISVKKTATLGKVQSSSIDTASLTCTDTLTSKGNIEVVKSAVFHDTLSVTKTIDANGDLVVKGKASTSELAVGGTLSVTHKLSANSGITVKGASTIQGSLNISSTGDTIALAATSKTGNSVSASNDSSTASTIFAEQRGSNSAVYALSKEGSCIYGKNNSSSVTALAIENASPDGSCAIIATNTSTTAATIYAENKANNASNYEPGNGTALHVDGDLRLPCASQYVNQYYPSHFYSLFVDGEGTVFANKTASPPQLASVSSRRFKENISHLVGQSEKIFDLAPVTFNYKNDQDKKTTFGLIAEEVDEVMPDLVIREKDGTPYSVAYDQLPVLLLQELKKVKQRLDNIDAIQAHKHPTGSDTNLSNPERGAHRVSEHHGPIPQSSYPEHIQQPTSESVAKHNRADKNHAANKMVTPQSNTESNGGAPHAGNNSEAGSDVDGAMGVKGLSPKATTQVESQANPVPQNTSVSQSAKSHTPPLRDDDAHAEIIRLKRRLSILEDEHGI